MQRLLFCYFGFVLLPKVLPQSDRPLHLHSQIDFLGVSEKNCYFFLVLYTVDELLIGVLRCAPGRCASLQYCFNQLYVSALQGIKQRRPFVLAEFVAIDPLLQDTFGNFCLVVDAGVGEWTFAIGLYFEAIFPILGKEAVQSLEIAHLYALEKGV